ncbi:MAG: P-type conjugative transfer protein TrbG [Gammaproteobacteria bacterium]|nr:P-type conjugative transfer protein TrbG [Gammaproteobacteria bacterium]
MRNLVLLLSLSSVLVACATPRPLEVLPDELVPAARLPEPPKPVEVVEIPRLLPLPGQLKPRGSESPAADPRDAVSEAHAAARVEPSLDNYVNATQLWPYSPEALYQVYASPERVTDLALEPGENLISVSAGDTVRWVIGDTRSGTGAEARVHVLVKPVRADLSTNLVIHTDRRSYHLELTATPDTWMATVAWRYPLDRLALLKTQTARAEALAPVATGVALERLNFRYAISGDSPAWRPLRAFDDGEKVYIQFPPGVSDLPPLFTVGPKDQVELVNYRSRPPYYLVDRLFETAELRLGADAQQVVRIRRVPAAERRR